MFKKYYISFFIVLVFSGCAKTYQVYNLPHSKVQSGMARIYILRPSFIGTVVKTTIYQNNNFVGYLGPKSYLCWDVQPGEILISSIAGNKEYFSVQAKAGQIYYFKELIKTRLLTPASELKPIPEKEAKEILQKVKNPYVKVV